MPDRDTTPSEALSAVREYFLRLDLDRAAYRDWCGGTVNGGPEGDGRYPLTDFTGHVHLVECPAKIASEAGGTGSAVPQLNTFGVTPKEAFEAFFSSTSAKVVSVPAGFYDDLRVFGATSTSQNGDGFPLAAGVEKTVIFEPGAVLRQAAFAKPHFRLRRPFVWTDSVSAMATTSMVDLSDDPTYVTENVVAVITLASPRSWKKGDILKIVSDDLVDGAKPHSNPLLRRRKGEFVIAGTTEVASTTLKITAPLKDTYTTNVRIALLDSAPVTIIGGELDFEDSLREAVIAGTISTVGFWAAIELYNIVDARVDGFRTRRAMNGGLIFKNCHGWTASNIELNNHLNIPSKILFGYGVSDFNSEGGRLLNIMGRNIRHVSDTGTSDVQASTDISNYGPSRDFIIQGMVAKAGQNGSAATHDECDGVLLTNFFIEGNYAGASSGGAGVALRGKNARLAQGRVINTRQGINANGIVGGLVEDVEVRGGWLSALNQGGGSTSANGVDISTIVRRSKLFQTVRPATFEACVVIRGTPSDERRCSMTMEDVTLGLEGSGNVARIVDLASGDFKAKKLTIDLRGWTGTLQSLFFCRDYDTNIEIDELTILAGSNTIRNLLTAPADTTNDPLPNRMTIRSIVYEGTLPFGGYDEDGRANSYSANQFNINYIRCPNLFVSGTKLEGSVAWETKFVTQSVHSGLGKVDVVDGGSGYTDGLNLYDVTISGTLGVDYTVAPEFDIVTFGGKVASVSIHYDTVTIGGEPTRVYRSGKGFKVAPTVTIEAPGGGGTQATATARLVRPDLQNLLDTEIIWQAQGGVDVETEEQHPTVYLQPVQTDLLPKHVKITYRNHSQATISSVGGPRMVLPPQSSDTYYANDFGTMMLVSRASAENRRYQPATGTQVPTSHFTVNINTMRDLIVQTNFPADRNITLPADAPEGCCIGILTTGSDGTFVPDTGATLIGDTKTGGVGMCWATVMKNEGGLAAVWALSGKTAA